MIFLHRYARADLYLLDDVLAAGTHPFHHHSTYVADTELSS